MQLKSAFSVILFSALFLQYQGKAQSFENPVDYMSYIGKANDELTVTYLSYMSAVAHNRAKKVEKRRMDLLNNITETRYKIQGMPPWKGDKAYRDTTVAYLKLLNHIFNDDFEKIVNMEEIAEQSYDLMEAYMLAQQKVAEKLLDAAARQGEMQKQFAAKYNITLIDKESELDKKSTEVSNLMKHYDEVYLIFFKPYKQEFFLMEAIEKKNILAIEENKNAMKKYAEEGLGKLKGMRGYNSDPSLINSCRQALDFYKKEAIETQAITDFFLKEDNFNKIKKAFESKPAAKRTQADVDTYNKAVNDINEGVGTFNNTNKQIIKEREKILEAWNNGVKKYLDTYMPVQRKA